MNDQTWQDVRGAIERILSSATKRIDIESDEARISVYRIGDQVRCDLRPLAQNGYTISIANARTVQPSDE